MKLRYACIGTGRIAKLKHLKPYYNSADIEIIAVCDSNKDAAEAVAKEFNVQNVYTDYNEMFEKETLDIVSICTPTFLHLPMTKKAFECGVNVHLEKPVALNQEEATEVIRLKKQYNKELLVAYNNRFTNQTYFIKNLIDNGELGEIYHIRCGWRRQRGLPVGWFLNKDLVGGGALFDLGIHIIDLMLYYLGYPEISAVSGQTYSKLVDKICQKDNPTVEDLAVGLLRLKNGVTVDFDFSYASHFDGNYNYYDILGTKGGIRYKQGEITLISDVGEKVINTTPDINFETQPMNEFEHFIALVKKEVEPVVKDSEVETLMKLLDAFYLSAEKNEEVKL